MYVYTRTGQSWDLNSKLTASDGAPDDNFGMDVQLYRNTVRLKQTDVPCQHLFQMVVGAPYHNSEGVSNTGAVYVFTRSGSEWTQVHKLLPDDATSEAAFGYSVAMDKYAVPPALIR